MLVTYVATIREPEIRRRPLLHLDSKGSHFTSFSFLRISKLLDLRHSLFSCSLHASLL